MLYEQPHLFPGLGSQTEVLFGMLLVVHSAAAVHVLAPVCLVILQHFLIMASAGGRSCRRCLVTLVCMILLYSPNRFLCLRVTVVDELRQEFQEPVIPHPG